MSRGGPGRPSADPGRLVVLSVGPPQPCESEAQSVAEVWVWRPQAPRELWEHAPAAAGARPRLLALAGNGLLGAGDTSADLLQSQREAESRLWRQVPAQPSAASRGAAFVPRRSWGRFLGADRTLTTETARAAQLPGGFEHSWLVTQFQ